MNNLILGLAVEELKLTKLKGKKQFNDAQFKEILGSLVELEKTIHIMTKRGVDFQKYIENRHNKSKKLPKYMVNVEQNTHFVYDDKELAKLTKDEEEAHYLEIFESEDVEEAQKALDKFGLGVEEFLQPDGAANSPIEVGGKRKRKSAQKKKVLTAALTV